MRHSVVGDVTATLTSSINFHLFQEPTVESSRSKTMLQLLNRDEEPFIRLNEDVMAH